ncbi:hypothetical protein BDV96DRAFT_606500 [Lophiotrema nucula]|uniref:Fungal N-terminal domain-containing protein n=1 Tax=Lophiotrema nucula TaxID=690887 RepID=A0A6A5YML7_9PLEO|nr:hypothetical protein BDV96DRAFT_606500 [Lophiotrema nucula]
MSGFEVLGAVAAALQFAATTVTAFRTIKADVNAVLLDVKSKAENYYVQEALDEALQWVRASLSALQSSRSLLSEIDAMLADAKQRSEWGEKLHKWVNADKSMEFTRRLDENRPNLESVNLNPPLLPTTMRREMIVKYDYQATAPNQHSLLKGEGVIKIGISPWEHQRLGQDHEGGRRAARCQIGTLELSHVYEHSLIAI